MSDIDSAQDDSDESQPTPTMAEIIAVLVGEQSWSESQRAARDGNYSWLLAEAEAWVFLGVGKPSGIEEMQRARRTCFRRSLDLITSFPEELIMPAYEVLWAWLPQQHLAEFSDIATDTFGCRGDPLINQLKDTFGGYLPDMNTWKTASRDQSVDDANQKVDDIGCGDPAEDFKFRLDRLLLHFASFRLKPQRMMHELTKLRSDHKSWNATQPNREDELHRSLADAFDALTNMSFDSESQDHAGRLLTAIMGRANDFGHRFHNGRKFSR